MTGRLDESEDAATPVGEGDFNSGGSRHKEVFQMTLQDLDGTGIDVEHAISWDSESQCSEKTIMCVDWQICG